MKEIKSYEDQLNKIKNYKIDSICENDILDIICGFGLAYDDRQLYGGYDGCMNSPGEIGLWQRPDQLSPLIKHLLGEEYKIDSFLEVGTYKASTFLILREFLLLKNKDMFSLTLDPNQVITNEFISHFNINYKKSNIHEVHEQYDLIFIDGDHAYHSVKSDYEKALSLSPKYILFHDIQDKYCPGVVEVWNEIKNTGAKNVEFKTDDDIMGLGLVVI